MRGRVITWNIPVLSPLQKASLQKNFARAIQLEGSKFFHSNPLQYFYLTKGEETVNMGKGFKEIDRKHCSQRKEDKMGNKQSKNSIPGEIFVRITASKHKHNKRLRFNGKVPPPSYVTSASTGL